MLIMNLIFFLYYIQVGVNVVSCIVLLIFIDYTTPKGLHLTHQNTKNKPKGLHLVYRLPLQTNLADLRDSPKFKSFLSEHSE